MNAFLMLSEGAGWRRCLPRPGTLVGLALVGVLAGWSHRVPSTSVFEAPEAAAQEAVSPGFLAVPMLNFLGDDNVCFSLIGLQNMGDEAAQAVAVFWGSTTAGQPCAGPLAVECSGLLTPGATWHMMGAQIPPSCRSAMVFSVTTRPLSAQGLDLGFDTPAASYLCAALSSHTFLGDCAAYARFREAWATGGTFAGLPLGVVAGPPLTAQVLRLCPGDQTPGVEVSASYSASWRKAEAQGSSQVSLAGPLRIPDEPEHSFVYLQNLGAGMAQASVDFHSAGSCEPARSCGQLTIDPGSAAYLSLSACGPAGAEGGLSIRSDTELAVTIDLTEADTMVSVEGTTAADWGTRLSGVPDPDPERGWSSVAYVQSPPDAERQTRVLLEHLGPDGAVSSREERPLCPGGVLSFSLPRVADRPGGRSGSLRVTSLDGVPVAAGVRLERSDGRGKLGEEAAFPLQPDAPEEAGLVQSLPFVVKDLAGGGVTTNLVLANHSTQPGWTELALLAYDASGPVEVHCQRLDAGQVDYIDIDNFYQVPTGFLGGLVVSPVWWSHADAAGSKVAPSIDASLVLLTGTRNGVNIPGDEMAISRGIRLSAAPAFLLQAATQRCGPLSRPAPARPTPPANSGLREEARQAMTWLPALADRNKDSTCLPVVTVTNRGDDPAQLLWLAWTTPGFCPPQDNDPMAYGCSGLLAPKGAWLLDSSTLPKEAGSGLVYSLSTASMLELGLDPASSESIAAVLCQRLSEQIDPAPSVEILLRQAFQTGGRFAGLPMAKAWGPTITATVSRNCPGNRTPGIQTTAAYPAAQTDGRPRGETGYRYALLPIVADRSWGINADKHGRTSILYFQNVGFSCATVLLDFQALGNCSVRYRCTESTLAPGESFAYDSSLCVGRQAGWIGSVTLSSNEPLALVMDQVGEDELQSLREQPTSLTFDLDGNGRREEADVDRVREALGRKRGDPDWDERLNLMPDDRIDAMDVDVAHRGLCLPAQPTGPALPRPDVPEPRLQTFLPALTGDGPGRDDCEATVAVQNLGQAPAKAIVLLWPTAAGGASDCTGPSRVECSPLLAPGGSWLLSQPALAGAASAVVFGVGSSDATPFLDFEGEISWADLICKSLTTIADGNCAGYLAFKTAWDGKRSFAGVPFDKLPAVPMGVRVERDCVAKRDSAPEGHHYRSAYMGLDAAQLGTWDEAIGAQVSMVPLLHGNKVGGLNTRLWLQAAGLAAAKVEVWLQAQNDCTGSRLCTTVTVLPGATASINPVFDCHLADWQGSAWLRSTGPIAVLADSEFRGSRSITASPMRQPPIGADPTTSAEATTLFAPVAPFDQEGWDVGINVQNQSLSQEAWVDVAFLDNHGAPVSTMDARICAGDSETFGLSVAEAAKLRLTSPGTIRVRSRPPAGRSGLGAAPISGVLTASRWAEPARFTLLETVSYPLLSDAAVGPWPLGQGRQGTGVVALPGLIRRGGTAQEHSRILLSNLSGLPGATTADIRLVDEHGTRWQGQQVLAGGEVKAIDLADLGLPEGFRGAALISATSWSHRRPDRPADTPVVALSAALTNFVGPADSEGVGQSVGMPVTLGLPLAAAPPPAPYRPLRSRIWLPWLERR